MAHAFYFLCLLFSNRECALHAHGAVAAYGAVVFEGAGFVGGELDYVRLATGNAFGGGIEFI